MSRKSKREALVFEMTPLIDVVFLLLIFFMVSSVFKKDELALLLKLPESQKGQGQSKVVDQVTIELASDTIAFNGEKISIDQLEVKLNDVAKTAVINLRADGDVKYKRLVFVLDELQKKKLNNVSLITDKKE